MSQGYSISASYCVSLCLESLHPFHVFHWVEAGLGPKTVLCCPKGTTLRRVYLERFLTRGNERRKACCLAFYQVWAPGFPVGYNKSPRLIHIAIEHGR